MARPKPLAALSEMSMEGSPTRPRAMERVRLVWGGVWSVISWRFLAIVASVAVIAGVVILVTEVPPAVIDKEMSSLVERGVPDSVSLAERLKAINDLRATLVTLLGGIAVALGTVIAAFNLGQARRALEE